MRIGLVGLGRIGQGHAATLLSLPAVDRLVVADADPGRAEALAAADRVEPVTSEALLTADLDGLVVATPSPAHAQWVCAAAEAGIPTFCEKPLATSIEDTIDTAARVSATGTPVQIGFQRRFDPGYRAARQAIAAGELGFVHTIRAISCDVTPPAAQFIPGSGGIFRDCAIHDADVVRYLTGAEVASVFATGGTKGAEYIAAAGDVDTGLAVLTLTDGTLASITVGRHNGQGQDVRLEVHGELGTVGVGWDDSLAVRSVEPGATQPAGPTHPDFTSRFAAAFTAELSEFCEVVARRSASPCTVHDALAAARVVEACDLSRRERRLVDLAEIPGADIPVTNGPDPSPAPAADDDLVLTAPTTPAPAKDHR
ncbi:Gfo/Idh/MocA family oxidoreductase [Marihabitans asiaticum]|uniref:Myo-inositol 2-dehydrogenase/D-chiro-inositol 1-dehydrogenase n=1 Tax=Marihabitans asiaticum TaxID=415218 RepID=A0A560WFR1_9MICO|nr:Gfo/Idh/MocA family oxidoreductase [Marihabitans asiaticum]TWD16521.1 myo-inositol 2-dehydrogenase/D-chiro-inositol 1-dehydrogenase [Marihabitans asiaticum]